MASDLPTGLRAAAEAQDGIVSASQIKKAGLTRGILNSRLRRGSWQRLHPGVYAVFSGEYSRRAELWAVLYAGPGAMLSHQTAAEVWKLVDAPSSMIHVTVPSTRRVRPRPGLTVHLSNRAGAALHPARNPPCARLDDTVIDLWATARSLDAAVGWITSAIGRRLTTQDNLQAALRARSRVPRRRQLAELLGPDAVGIHSVLEYRYVRYVERPHGLTGAKRQVQVRRDGRTEYRDQLYVAYRTAVELDGRVAHPGDTRWNDIRRDNAAAAMGITTLRYGWRDVTANPCRVAAQIAEVLAASGYTGARPCSAGCPVGRQPDQAQTARPRRDEHSTSTSRVPARAARQAGQRTSRRLRGRLSSSTSSGGHCSSQNGDEALRP
jgi:very-short-patch-repair endonuclease